MTEPESIVAGLTIRTFRPADRDALVALWDRCGLLRPHNDPDRDLALWRTSVNAEIFLGEHDGRIVASVCVGHDGHRGYAYYVAVDPDDRGRGIGRSMMRHAEAWLTRLGVPKMNAMVRDDNEEARGFYAAIGYRETPRFVLERWLTPDKRAPVGSSEEIGHLRCTVTYLEMTERPIPAPTSAPHRLNTALLRAHCPTVAFYRFLYNAVGEPWLWYERRAMDDEALKAIVQDD
ncbi:MAG TPA: GNAT family acetyltransferase, partial [Kiloniellales bacterium]|nr:GNAT family acetyltransferase [Kiloniellales bacterium]